MLLIFPATSGVPDQVGRASYVSKPAHDSVRCVSVWPQVSEDRRRQWADVRRVLWPHRVRIIALGGSSFATGAVETALLVVITRVGLAIAEDDPSFGVLAGLSMSVEGAIPARPRTPRCPRTEQRALRRPHRRPVPPRIRARPW